MLSNNSYPDTSPGSQRKRRNPSVVGLGEMNEIEFPQFHLRRIGPKATKHGVADTMDFEKVATLIGRNRSQVDFYLDSVNYIASQYISRLHAHIVKQGDNTYLLYDDSLNGIFVNNSKIQGSVVLHEGDIVTFGHPNGANLAAGVWKRQPDSEYQFLFEKCSCQPPTKKSRLNLMADQVKETLIHKDKISNSVHCEHAHSAQCCNDTTIVTDSEQDEPCAARDFIRPDPSAMSAHNLSPARDKIYAEVAGQCMVVTEGNLLRGSNMRCNDPGQAVLPEQRCGQAETGFIERTQGTREPNQFRSEHNQLMNKHNQGATEHSQRFDGNKVTVKHRHFVQGSDENFHHFTEGLKILAPTDIAIPCLPDGDSQEVEAPLTFTSNKLLVTPTTGNFACNTTSVVTTCLSKSVCSATSIDETTSHCAACFDASHVNVQFPVVEDKKNMLPTSPGSKCSCGRNSPDLFTEKVPCDTVKDAKLQKMSCQADLVPSDIVVCTGHKGSVRNKSLEEISQSSPSVRTEVFKSICEDFKDDSQDAFGMELQCLMEKFTRQEDEEVDEASSRTGIIKKLPVPTNRINPCSAGKHVCEVSSVNEAATDIRSPISSPVVAYSQPGLLNRKEACQVSTSVRASLTVDSNLDDGISIQKDSGSGKISGELCETNSASRNVLCMVSSSSQESSSCVKADSEEFAKSEACNQMSCKNLSQNSATYTKAGCDKHFRKAKGKTAGKNVVPEFPSSSQETAECDQIAGVFTTVEQDSVGKIVFCEAPSSSQDSSVQVKIVCPKVSTSLQPTSSCDKCSSEVSSSSQDDLPIVKTVCETPVSASLDLTGRTALCQIHLPCQENSTLRNVCQVLSNTQVDSEKVSNYKKFCSQEENDDSNSKLYERDVAVKQGYEREIPAKMEASNKPIGSVASFHQISSIASLQQTMNIHIIEVDSNTRSTVPVIEKTAADVNHCHSGRQSVDSHDHAVQNNLSTNDCIIGPVDEFSVEKLAWQSSLNKLTLEIREPSRKEITDFCHVETDDHTVIDTNKIEVGHNININKKLTVDSADNLTVKSDDRVKEPCHNSNNNFVTAGALTYQNTDFQTAGGNAKSGHRKQISSLFCEGLAESCETDCGGHAAGSTDLSKPECQNKIVYVESSGACNLEDNLCDESSLKEKCVASLNSDCKHVPKACEFGTSNIARDVLSSFTINQQFEVVRGETSQENNKVEAERKSLSSLDSDDEEVRKVDTSNYSCTKENSQVQNNSRICIKENSEVQEYNVDVFANKSSQGNTDTHHIHKINQENAVDYFIDMNRQGNTENLYVQSNSKGNTNNLPIGRNNQEDSASAAKTNNLPIGRNNQEDSASAANTNNLPIGRNNQENSASAANTNNLPIGINNQEDSADLFSIQKSQENSDELYSEQNSQEHISDLHSDQNNLECRDDFHSNESNEENADNVYSDCNSQGNDEDLHSDQRNSQENTENVHSHKNSRGNTEDLNLDQSSQGNPDDLNSDQSSQGNTEDLHSDQNSQGNAEDLHSDQNSQENAEDLHSDPTSQGNAEDLHSDPNSQENAEDLHSHPDSQGNAEDLHSHPDSEENAEDLHSDPNSQGNAEDLHSDPNSQENAEDLHSDPNSQGNAEDLHSDLNSQGNAEDLHSDLNSQENVKDLHSDPNSQENAEDLHSDPNSQENAEDLHSDSNSQGNAEDLHSDPNSQENAEDLHSDPNSQENAADLHSVSNSSVETCSVEDGDQSPDCYIDKTSQVLDYTCSNSVNKQDNTSVDANSQGDTEGSLNINSQGDSGGSDIDRNSQEDIEDSHVDRSSERSIEDFHVDRRSERDIEDFHVDRSSERDIEDFHVDRRSERDIEDFHVDRSSERDIEDSHVDRRSEGDIEDSHIDRSNEGDSKDTDVYQNSQRDSEDSNIDRYSQEDIGVLHVESNSPEFSNQHSEHNQKYAEEDNAEDIHKEHADEDNTEDIHEEHAEEDNTEDIDEEHAEEDNTEDIHEEYADEDNTEDIGKEHAEEDNTEDIDKEHAEEDNTEDIDKEHAEEDNTEDIDKEHAEEDNTEDIHEEHAEEDNTEDIDKEHADEDNTEDIGEEHAEENDTEDIDEEHAEEDDTEDIHEEHAEEHYTEDIHEAYSKEDSQGDADEEYTKEDNEENTDEDYTKKGSNKDIDEEYTKEHSKEELSMDSQEDADEEYKQEDSKEYIDEKYTDDDNKEITEEEYAKEDSNEDIDVENSKEDSHGDAENMNSQSEIDGLCVDRSNLDVDDISVDRNIQNNDDEINIDRHNQDKDDDINVGRNIQLDISFDRNNQHNDDNINVHRNNQDHDDDISVDRNTKDIDDNTSVYGNSQDDDGNSTVDRNNLAEQMATDNLDTVAYTKKPGTEMKEDRCLIPDPVPLSGIQQAHHVIRLTEIDTTMTSDITVGLVAIDLQTTITGGCSDTQINNCSEAQVSNFSLVRDELDDGQFITSTPNDENKSSQELFASPVKASVEGQTIQGDYSASEVQQSYCCGRNKIESLHLINCKCMSIVDLSETVVNDPQGSDLREVRPEINSAASLFEKDTGKKSVVGSLGAQEVGRSFTAQKVDRLFGTQEVGRSLGAQEVYRSLGAQEVDRSLGAQEVGRSLGAQEVGRSLGAQEVGRSLGAQEVGRSLGAQEVGRSLGAQEVDRSLGAQGVGRSLSTHEAVRSFGAQEVGRSFGDDGCLPCCIQIPCLDGGVVSCNQPSGCAAIIDCKVGKCSRKSQAGSDDICVNKVHQARAGCVSRNCQAETDDIYVNENSQTDTDDIHVNKNSQAGTDDIHVNRNSQTNTDGIHVGRSRQTDTDISHVNKNSQTDTDDIHNLNSTQADSNEETDKRELENLKPVYEKDNFGKVTAGFSNVLKRKAEDDQMLDMKPKQRKVVSEEEINQERLDNSESSTVRVKMVQDETGSLNVYNEGLVFLKGDNDTAMDEVHTGKAAVEGKTLSLVQLDVSGGVGSVVGNEESVSEEQMSNHTLVNSKTEYSVVQLATIIVDKAAEIDTHVDDEITSVKKYPTELSRERCSEDQVNQVVVDKMEAETHITSLSGAMLWDSEDEVQKNLNVIHIDVKLDKEGYQKNNKIIDGLVRSVQAEHSEVQQDDYVGEEETLSCATENIHSLPCDSSDVLNGADLVVEDVHTCNTTSKESMLSACILNSDQVINFSSQQVNVASVHSDDVNIADAHSEEVNVASVHSDDVNIADAHSEEVNVAEVCREKDMTMKNTIPPDTVEHGIGVSISTENLNMKYQNENMQLTNTENGRQCNQDTKQNMNSIDRVDSENNLSGAGYPEEKQYTDTESTVPILASCDIWQERVQNLALTDENSKIPNVTKESSKTSTYQRSNSTCSDSGKSNVCKVMEYTSTENANPTVIFKEERIDVDISASIDLFSQDAQYIYLDDRETVSQSVEFSNQHSEHNQKYINEEHADDDNTEDIHKEHAEEDSTEDIDEEHADEDNTEDIHKEHAEEDNTDYIYEEHADDDNTEDIHEEHADENNTEDIHKEHADEDNTEDIHEEQADEDSTEDQMNQVVDKMEDETHITSLSGTMVMDSEEEFQKDLNVIHIDVKLDKEGYQKKNKIIDGLVTSVQTEHSEVPQDHYVGEEGTLSCATANIHSLPCDSSDVLNGADLVVEDVHTCNTTSKESMLSACILNSDQVINFSSQQVNVASVHSDDVNIADAHSEEVNVASVHSDDVNIADAHSEEVNVASVHSDNVNIADAHSEEVNVASVHSDNVNIADAHSEEVNVASVHSDDVNIADAHSEEVNVASVHSDNVNIADAHSEEVNVAEVCREKDMTMKNTIPPDTVEHGIGVSISTENLNMKYQNENMELTNTENGRQCNQDTKQNMNSIDRVDSENNLSGAGYPEEKQYTDTESTVPILASCDIWQERVQNLALTDENSKIPNVTKESSKTSTYQRSNSTCSDSGKSNVCKVMEYTSTENANPTVIFKEERIDVDISASIDLFSQDAQYIYLDDRETVSQSVEFSNRHSEHNQKYINEEHADDDNTEDIHKEHAEEDSTEDIDEEHADNDNTEDIHKEHAEEDNTEDIHKEHADEDNTEDIHKEHAEEDNTDYIYEEHADDDNTEDIHEEHADENNTEDIHKEHADEDNTEDIHEEQADEDSTEDQMNQVVDKMEDETHITSLSGTMVMDSEEEFQKDLNVIHIDVKLDKEGYQKKNKIIDRLVTSVQTEHSEVPQDHYVGEEGTLSCATENIHSLPCDSSDVLNGADLVVEDVHTCNTTSKESMLSACILNSDQVINFSSQQVNVASVHSDDVNIADAHSEEVNVASVHSDDVNIADAHSEEVNVASVHSDDVNIADAHSEEVNVAEVCREIDMTMKHTIPPDTVEHGIGVSISTENLNMKHQNENMQLTNTENGRQCNQDTKQNMNSIDRVDSENNLSGAGYPEEKQYTDTESTVPILASCDIWQERVQNLALTDENSKIPNVTKESSKTSTYQRSNSTCSDRSKSNVCKVMEYTSIENANPTVIFNEERINVDISASIDLFSQDAQYIYVDERKTVSQSLEDYVVQDSEYIKDGKMYVCGEMCVAKECSVSSENFSIGKTNDYNNEGCNQPVISQVSDFNGEGSNQLVISQISDFNNDENVKLVTDQINEEVYRESATSQSIFNKNGHRKSQMSGFNEQELRESVTSQISGFNEQELRESVTSQISNCNGNVDRESVSSQIIVFNDEGINNLVTSQINDFNDGEDKESVISLMSYSNNEGNYKITASQINDCNEEEDRESVSSQVEGSDKLAKSQINDCNDVEDKESVTSHLSYYNNVGNDRLASSQIHDCNEEENTIQVSDSKNEEDGEELVTSEMSDFNEGNDKLASSQFKDCNEEEDLSVTIQVRDSKNEEEDREESVTSEVSDFNDEEELHLVWSQCDTGTDKSSFEEDVDESAYNQLQASPKDNSQTTSADKNGDDKFSIYVNKETVSTGKEFHSKIKIKAVCEDDYNEETIKSDSAVSRKEGRAGMEDRQSAELLTDDMPNSCASTVSFSKPLASGAEILHSQTCTGDIYSWVSVGDQEKPLQNEGLEYVWDENDTSQINILSQDVGDVDSNTSSPADISDELNSSQGFEITTVAGLPTDFDCFDTPGNVKDQQEYCACQFKEIGCGQHKEDICQTAKKLSPEAEIRSSCGKCAKVHLKPDKNNIDRNPSQGNTRESQNNESAGSCAREAEDKLGEKETSKMPEIKHTKRKYGESLDSPLKKMAKFDDWSDF